MTKTLGKEGSFAEGPSNSPRQRFFLKILKISLPRAREQTLGKGFFLKKIKKKPFLCRGPALGKEFFLKKKPLLRALAIALGKDFFGKNPENFFAEGQGGGPRQRFLKKIKKFICRGPALGKKIQKKTICLPRVGPRQRNRQRRWRLMASFLCRGPSWPSAKALSSAR